jgi:hypothetical protein
MHVTAKYGRQATGQAMLLRSEIYGCFVRVESFLVTLGAALGMSLEAHEASHHVRINVMLGMKYSMVVFSLVPGQALRCGPMCRLLMRARSLMGSWPR